MRKLLAILILCLILVSQTKAQEVIYLPVILKGVVMPSTDDAVLQLTDGTVIVDLIGPNSGWKLADPYWNPQIAQFKGGGAFANSALAEGRQLVHKEYDNVIETIPLSVRGKDQNRALKTIRELMQLGRQASDYWSEPYEYDPVWLEARPACNDCLTGYTRIFTARLAELTNPYGQPFYSDLNPDSIMEGITLIIEREPFWRATEPGTIIGPLYNLIKNPDFELWNFGVADSQPDNWNDLETLWITGTNNRQDTAVKYGEYALKIRVSGSTLAGAAKGINQIIADTKDATEYTVLAWVRSEGVSNGVGRILVTYSSQLELYRASNRHGWTLYAATFTTGNNDVVGISCEILTTAANTDGTIYIDGMMLVEGDWVTEAENGVLPWMTSSHIVNHWDQPAGAVVEAGDINWVDVWNIPGDVDTLIRLEVQNNTTPADAENIVERYATVRVGQRRALNVLDFQNYHDPTGVADTTASSDDRVDIAIATGWQDITSQVIVGGSLARNNEGRTRVLARVYDEAANPTLEARLRYWIGVSQVNVVTRTAVSIPIRGDWCIVNLTPNAAMVQETKFKGDLPGALGRTVQLRRSTGSDGARFDYMLIMPTDGGYLEASLDPPYGQGAALVVDNTASQMVSTSGVLTGYTTRFEITGGAGNPYISLRGMAEYKGDIYAGADRNTGPAKVWRYRDGTWSEVFSLSSEDAARALEVYNGRLYAAFDNGGGNATVYSTEDGESWGFEFTANNNWIHEMRSFDGYLWLGGGQDLTRYVMRWDGSVLVNDYTVPLQHDVQAFEVYKNQLFIGTGQWTAGGTGRLFSRDSNTGIWSLLETTDEILDLQIFNGKLYLGTAPDGKIYEYDGSSLTQVYDPGISVSRIYALEELDGKLYAGITFIGTLEAQVLESSDGTTWSLVYDPTEIAPIWRMLGFEGVLHVGTSETGGNGVLTIDSIVLDKEVQYSVSDYQGSSFTAPSRQLPNNPRRHRYFFSYDRDNFINNVDDKALIGIGFVPRYLSLRGKD